MYQPQLTVHGITKEWKRCTSPAHKPEDSKGEKKLNQQDGGSERARLKAPSWSNNQLMIVANIAGGASRKNLRNALLAIIALAASGLPARTIFRGFIEQT